MADFDAIYQIEDEPPLPSAAPKVEPILIRGTGNMTVYVQFFIFTCGSWSCLFLFGEDKKSTLLCLFIYNQASLFVLHFIYSQIRFK